jgi:uncharacterized phage infection (PIP) family protein YhgE
MTPILVALAMWTALGIFTIGMINVAKALVRRNYQAQEREHQHVDTQDHERSQHPARD